MAKNDALNTLTASVGVSLKENNFTITVTLSVPLSTRYGSRKSDHAAVIAKIATTEMIGLDNGSMIVTNILHTPQPSSSAASTSSFGISSKKLFEQHYIKGVCSKCQPQRYKALIQSYQIDVTKYSNNTNGTRDQQTPHYQSVDDLITLRF